MDLLWGEMTPHLHHNALLTPAIAGSLTGRGLDPQYQLQQCSRPRLHNTEQKNDNKFNKCSIETGQGKNSTFNCDSKTQLNVNKQGCFNLSKSYVASCSLELNYKNVQSGGLFKTLFMNSMKLVIPLQFIL